MSADDKNEDELDNLHGQIQALDERVDKLCLTVGNLKRAVAIANTLLEQHYPAAFQLNCSKCGAKMEVTDARCRKCSAPKAATRVAGGES